MIYKKKIVAVSSIGGHWIQLLRIIKPLESKYDITYMCTHSNCKSMVGNSNYKTITDFSRWNIWRLIPSFFVIFFYLILNRPSVIISTGAAPGLLTILVGRILFINTIWIDSIANVEKLSMCGKFACKISKHIFTQWPDLATSKIKYYGNVFGD